MEFANTTSTTDPVNMYNYLNSYMLNPIVFIILFLTIVAYYVFSTYLGNEESSNILEEKTSPFGIIIIAILVLLIGANALQYFFSINVTAYVKGLFTPNATLDVVVDQSKYQPKPAVREMKFRKQVFNIPGNYYTYNNAKAICQAYGADLASYQQVEKSYENGGEWCNYGWSDGQMALFPTQQKTFQGLQKIPGHEHDCGRPGVNGGYIANPKIKFGVNCYGNKPRMNDEEEELMKTLTPYPETTDDLLFQKQVDYWKNKVNDILVSPFNYNSWGEY